MNELVLDADTNARLRYRVPSSGLFEFSIEADEPVASYIVRPGGLEEFDQGKKRFRYYGGFPEARKVQHQFLKLPYSGTHYLLIVNRDARRVRVKYDVLLPRS